MSTIQHNTLTGAEIHEPKGAAGASAGEVYEADGLGSGAWKQIYTQGFEDYNHGGAGQAMAAGVPLKILNDGAGGFTNTTYRLPGKGAIWNTVNNQFDWSGAGLSLGDTVDIRFDFSVTTNAVNDDISILLDMAVGSGAPYTLTVEYTEWRYVGTYNYTAWYSVYMGDTNSLNFPAEVKLLASAAGCTVQVNGFYVRTVPRLPVTA